ncbi:MAG: hypothetical protein K6G40_01280 [Eubacterium sp.]|nr:hypothetical protein [Eubacterium sp.]
MNRKKALAVIMTCAMLGALAACGNSAQTESGAATETAEVTSEAAFEEEVVPNYIGTLIPTFAKRVNDSYTLGLYVQGNEVVEDYSYLGEFAEATEEGVNISDIAIEAEGSGFTALAIQRTEADEASTVNLSNVDITLTDASDDGSNVSDFTGLGAALVASGATETDHIKLNIDGMNLTTTGFERDGIIVDDYADAVVENSNIVVNGNDPLNNAYDGYINSANQALMLSPPWILGIQGGARAANVLGDYSSLTIADSYVESGAWAVLSTDDCTEPTINVINSELAIATADSEYGLNGGAELFGYDYNYGSGYGTYNIGASNEYFYGATFTGVTEATIMTGTGEMYFGPSSDGLTVNDGTGNEVYTYSGEAKDTVVNGVFGLMDHQSGTATLDAGSVWNTEDAVILKKGSGESTYTVTGAELNSNSGVLFQLMDDDDGYGTSAFESAATAFNGDAFGMPSFPSGWTDLNAAGLPSASGSLSEGGVVTSTLNLSDSTYSGNIYNGSGSGKDKDATGLAVNLTNATLDGAISSTEAVHGLPYTEEAASYLDNLAATYNDSYNVQGDEGSLDADGGYGVTYALLDAEGNVTEDAANAAYIQLLEYTMNEYYIQGHMVNFAAAAGSVEVTVDNSTWNVTEDSYISYLNVAEGSTVTVADGATLYIAGKAYTGTVEAGEYGEVFVAEEGGEEGMMMGPMEEETEETTEVPEINITNTVQLKVYKK